MKKKMFIVVIFVTLVIVTLIVLKLETNNVETLNPTLVPTATQKPTLTPTVTPETTSTPTLEPTSTQAPEPTSTPTPKPTNTPTPEPTSTQAPEPTSTPTPKPTNTPTPETTSTQAPEPTSTPTPKPTNTPTPEPTTVAHNFNSNDLDMSYEEYYLCCRYRTFSSLNNGMNTPDYEIYWGPDFYEYVTDTGRFYEYGSSDFDIDNKVDIPIYFAGTVTLPHDIDKESLYEIARFYNYAVSEYSDYVKFKEYDNPYLSAVTRGWSRENECYIDKTRSTDDVWYCYVFDFWVAADKDLWQYDDYNIIGNGIECTEFKIVFDDTSVNDYNFPYK